MLKEKAIIIFTVAIDVIGIGIIIPVLPLYVESFGLSAFYVTGLLSVFSLFSFLSAPFLGALSDKIGRRPVLIISIASTSLGWFIFAMANSLPLLILGRIIDGMAAGNFSTAQSAMSDLSKTPKERTSNLGIIGMIFGLGFIVGPFIGGVLSKVTPSFPFYFVGGLSLLNAILAYFFLPETNQHIVKNKKLSYNPISPLVKAVKNKKLRTLYGIWFLFNLIAVSCNSIFALYLYKIFNLDSFQTGLLFTFLGIILTINQGFLIRKFWLEKFQEKQLILIMLIVFAIGFLIMSIPYLAIFIIGMVFTALGQSTLGVAMTGEIVGEANEKERGAAVGILSAIASFAMILAPLFAGKAFESHPSLPYIVGSIFSLIAFVIMYQTKVSNHKSKEITNMANEVLG